MTVKLKEGQFLGPFGMYSVSRLDRTHWDLEDTDWGGGGQYIGATLRIGELLYRVGQPDLAWDVLSRCLRWVEKYPYFPQDVFTDSGEWPRAEMPLEISAGGGVQAILFGVFGLRPNADGALKIAPAYHPSLGRAAMKGYRFHGHTYDVVMNPAGFQVFRDGKLVAEKEHGSTVMAAALPEQAAEPFNGKNLDGWNLRPRRNVTVGKWTAGAAKPRDANPAELDALPGGTELVNTGKALNIYTAAKFGDMHLEIEVLVPRGANSGIYLMGNYEIQVFDSFGKKNAGAADMGAVYDKTAPRCNAALPPGQWQKFVIDFRAPKFDNQGNKTADARLVRCTLNGRLIHENVKINGLTGAAMSKQEVPTGPLMLQGDHSPVAYRNIKITALEE